MTVEFFMPMEHVPTVTAQEHKVTVVNGKPRFYDPSELARAKANIIAALLARPRPTEKLTGPPHLHTIWCFLTDRHPDGAWRDTKPDTDNLQKLLKDCMTQVGYWEDDAQVCSELVEKRWVRGIQKGGTASGIWIHIRQMEKNNG